MYNYEYKNCCLSYGAELVFERSEKVSQINKTFSGVDKLDDKQIRRRHLKRKKTIENYEKKDENERDINCLQTNCVRKNCLQTTA